MRIRTVLEYRWNPFLWIIRLSHFKGKWISQHSPSGRSYIAINLVSRATIFPQIPSWRCNHLGES